jgi:hypothetical protein
MPIATKQGSRWTEAGKQRMRWMFVFLCFPVCLKAVSEQTALAGKSVLEKVEWTWADRPAKPDSALPNVLLAGDSIARGYFPAVTTLMAGKANVYLFATSASAGDPRLLKQLDDYFAMEPLKFSVIHFNNGMHGWGYSEAAYSEALPAMVRLLQRDSPGSKLIWASTTPVHKKLESGASNERLEARNAAALAVMKKLAIPVDDQYVLMAAHDDLYADDVHYKSEGSRIEAEQLVRMVITALASDLR